jgi:phenylacetate-CoA ligase
MCSPITGVSNAPASRPYKASFFSPRLETMARGDLETLQLERLTRSIARAYSLVPHYQQAFDAAGADPGSLKTLDDIRRFPLTAKDDLRRNYPFGMFTVPPSSLARLHASSGTTGKPTVVGYTDWDLDIWAELMARSMTAAGIGPTDIVHNALGYGLFTGGLGVHDGARRLGATIVPMSGGNTENQVMLMEDFGATVLCATPSYAMTIAEMAENMGVDLANGPLRVGLFGAEPWSPAMRTELEARLGITAVDLYGLSEVMGPGVACECALARDGHHLWEDHFLLECIDPDSGEPVADGDPGELVITTLTKEALPMVRYRTRDITRLSDAPCICGRTHRRMMRVAGRSDDMLIVRGVNLFPSQVEAALVGVPDVAPCYQIVVDRQESLDDLVVEIELIPDAVLDPKRVDQAKAAVKRRIRTMIGIGCDVVAKNPGTIPRSEGKAVRVRDLRKL